MPLPVPLAQLSVDHAVIRHNIERIRARNTAKLMAVVKADAFGHGSVPVARTAVAAGVEWLGVATVEEGLELRAAGLTAPILAWLIDPWVELEAAIRADIVLSLANSETLAAVVGIAESSGVQAEVHLEIDTGMFRAGTPEALWGELCRRAAEAERDGHVRVTGVWSHLANANDPDWAAVATQWARFEAALTTARGLGLDPLDVHLANSAATFAHPRTALTMVRCGASLFGIETVDGREHGIEYAARLTSRVTQLRQVEAGAAVGYGSVWTAPTATRLALVPLGYADGVPRGLSNRGEAVVGGRRVPIVGRISMDQLVLDVGDAPVALGDEVVLLGDRRAGEPDPQEWSDLLDTISHEILTGFGPRIHRTHLNEER